MKNSAMNEVLYNTITPASIGQVIADANLDAARSIPEFDLQELVPQADIPVIGSIVNAGTLSPFFTPDYSQIDRQDRATDTLLEFGIEQLLPSNNDLVVLTLTRKELADIIEYGVGSANQNGFSEQFPYVSGLQFSFDPDETRIYLDSAQDGNIITQGERLQTLDVVDEQGSIIDSIIKDGEFQGSPDEPVRIVTTSFLAGGGLDYPFPAFGENVVNLRDSLDRLLFLDPLIDFDQSRRTDTTSGLFFIDDTMVPVFDFSNPKRLEIDIEERRLLIKTDILSTPEEALAFNNENLTGTDAGDAIIDASIVPNGDHFEIVSGTTSISFDDELLSGLGFTLSDVENGAKPDDGFDVGYRIVPNDEGNLIFDLEGGFQPIDGSIKHIGNVSLEYQSAATFARAGTEQDALAEYLINALSDDGSLDWKEDFIDTLL